MSIFDRLEKHYDGSATAVPATIAVQRVESGGKTAKTAGIAAATPPSVNPEIPPEEGGNDPVALAERIAIKFEAETPEDLGEPVIVDRGQVLACEKDLPHIRFYAWALIHLHTGQNLPIDTAKVARDCHLSAREVSEAIDKLIRDKDLERIRGRYPARGDLYRLVINYGGAAR